MSAMLDRVVDRRNRLWNEMRSYLDDLETRGLDLTGSHAATYKAMDAELDEYDARIQELRGVDKRAADAEEANALYGRSARPPADDDSLAVRAFMRGDRRTIDLDLREVRHSVDTRTGRRETRDLSVGSSTAGGNTVPTSFRSQLVEHMVDASAIRQTNVTVLTTNSGEALEVPKTTAISTAAIVAEAGTIGKSDPAFGKMTLNAYKYAVMLQASRELVDDSGIDLVGYLARETGMAIGLASGAHFVTGDGSGKPNGVATAATVGKTGATGVAGVFTADDLIDLYHSVIPSYRRNGFWLMSDDTAAAARKLKDDNGQYLWQVSLTADTPSTLLGRPVVIDPNVASVAADARSVLFGDMSRYFIRDVRGVRFERSDDFAFDEDQVTWRAILRTDGDLADLTGAVKCFKGGPAS